LDAAVSVFDLILFVADVVVKTFDFLGEKGDFVFVFNQETFFFTEFADYLLQLRNFSLLGFDRAFSVIQIKI